MIFCTNHKHGFIEMASNMLRRWNEMQEAERNGQLQLFEMNVDFRGEHIQYDYKKIVLDELTSEYIGYDDFICTILKKYGILCDVRKINKMVKDFESDNIIDVFRSPEYTPSGKKATWVDWKFPSENKKILKVRLKNEVC